MTLITILTILFVHWVADFVTQTSWQAQNKSKEWEALLSHTSTYSFCWFIPIMCLWPEGYDSAWYILKTLSFIGITLICHTATDYYTSRVNAKLWEEKKVRGFFVSIGFDQWLHYVQLFITFELLK